MLLAAMLSPGLLQITECGRGNSGNSLLTSLELEAGGQNRVVGFMSSQREYDVWVPEALGDVVVRAVSFDPGSTIELSYFGNTDPIGEGSGEISVVVPAGESTLVVLVTAPGGAVRSYLLHATHTVDPPSCNGGAPKAAAVDVACLDSAFMEQKVLPFELSVTPSAIQAGEPFTADVGGKAVIDEQWMDAIQTVVLGGSTTFWLADIVATVQVRSGAVGPDVTLRVDETAIVPGPTRFCTLPYGFACTSDSDCDVPPCLPPVNVVDIPTSTVQATCTALGKDNQFNANGFCVTGPGEVPLETQTVTYTADTSGDEVRWGWADQGVPGLVLCPDAMEPRCENNGGTVPDGTYALPQVLYLDPPGSVGVRMTAPFDQLVIAEECVMAVQSFDGGGAPIPNVVEPTPDSDLLACLIHPPACFVNSDCPSGYNCVNHSPVSCTSGGVCEPVPGACDTLVWEVCGCDGTTYVNYCDALVLGVRTSAWGACECTTNSDCAPSEYCNAVTCDGPGTCTPMPSTCDPGSGYVLACDDLIYDSVCAAAAVGVRAGGEIYPPLPF